MTNIEWTDVTWNPTRGCSRVSEGCRHCYAERQAYRVNAMQRAQGNPEPYAGLVEKVGNEPRWTGRVELVLEKLREPLSWRQPKRVFVNSMSDLFHESLSLPLIGVVFGVMSAAPQHTFQVLTKRPERMREWFGQIDQLARDSKDYPERLCWRLAREWGIAVGGWPPIEAGRIREARWPLPNVWLGVSVEDQRTADERIPHLLQTPAAVRFVSAEPLLGPINFDDGPLDTASTMGPWSQLDLLDWLIVGSESGPRARPMKVEWARKLVDDCEAARVPCFVKQIANDRDRKGGNPEHWPAGWWPREFPR